MCLTSLPILKRYPSSIPERKTCTLPDLSCIFQSDRIMLFPCFAEHDIIWYGISPWLVQVTCPLCLPQPIAHPRLDSLQGAKSETGAALMLCKHCSVKARRLGYYQYSFGKKSKSQHCMSCHEENVLCPSQGQYSLNLRRGCLVSVFYIKCIFLIIPWNSHLYLLLLSHKSNKPAAQPR